MSGPQPATGRQIVVGVISGGVDSSFARIASDLDAVISSDTLRIVPVLGRGSLRNIADLLGLGTVDLALVDIDVLNHARRQGLYPDLTNTIRYVAKLYDAEVHILARKDIRVPADLDGKPVAVGTADSGAGITAAALFGAFGIHPKLIEVEPDLARAQLRTGELAAMVAITGKPTGLFSDLPADAGLHFLSVPLDQPLMDAYAPAWIGHDDYPALIPDGQRIETISTGVALIVFNWPAGTERHRALSRFIDAFFSGAPALSQPPRHPKWRDFNPFAQIPGWQRYQPAAAWLESRQQGILRSRAPPSRAQFDAFLAARGTNMSEEERTRLYQGLLDFLTRQH